MSDRCWNCRVRLDQHEPHVSRRPSGGPIVYCRVCEAFSPSKGVDEHPI
ncbi:hypothetical protein [Halohasta litorea]|uniref:Small CPxCG-related zinc finger protein n=1 Tax=Halohasta litorea TaxID=869891 RepID=A0ABD6D9X9_9EURY|nr:hypothetical protein [Halohasta litorea]